MCKYHFGDAYHEVCTLLGVYINYGVLPILRFRVQILGLRVEGLDARIAQQCRHDCKRPVWSEGTLQGLGLRV